MNQSIPKISLICILLFFALSISAEGTKELAPNENTDINGTSTNDIAALYINKDTHGRFAQWGSSDINSRLFINIQDPENECIYLGFSAPHQNFTGQNPPTFNAEFRILDPNGNVVYGPITLSDDDPTIQNWQEGFNGPSEIHGSDGYDGFFVSNDQLTIEGDYYIEFRQQNQAGQPILIDYWDISVANCSGTFPEYKKGRVWSYNWGLFAINDFGFPERPFNGSFYVCAPDGESENHKSFISKIDFNNSGFKPAAFNIAFNSYGTKNTGDIEDDRRSRENENSTTPEYSIYLNDPIDLCDEADYGQVELLDLYDTSGDFCILANIEQAGQLEIILDFHLNDGIYTENTADRLIAVDIEESQTNQDICIDWDGLDGDGNKRRGNIPIVLNYAQGIYHFPIFDAELMENGFSVESVRPSGPEPMLFYDDQYISVPSGTSEPKVNLNGCDLPCHAWTNYTGGNIAGFGNLNTINTWWFSQLISFETSFELADIVCEIAGQDSICPGERIILTASLIDEAGGVAPDIESIEWDGPSIITDPTDVDVVIDQPGVYTADISYIGEDGNTLMTTCSKIVAENPEEECCALEIECPSIMIDSFVCKSEIPPVPQGYEDLESIGITIEDTSCINLLINVEIDSSGEGCIGSPFRVLRNLQIIDDENENGSFDIGEDRESCLLTYVAIDDVLPELTVPDDITLDCVDLDDTEITGEPEVSDNCSEVVFSYEDILPTEQSCDGETPIQRIWTVMDECGNMVSDTQLIYVEDDISPELEFNHPLLDSLENGGTLNYECFAKENQDWTLPDLGDEPVLAEDNCGTVDLEFKETLIGEGNCTEDGYLARYQCMWIATDNCGNTDSIYFFLNIIDKTAPVFLNTPEDITLTCGEDIPESEIEATDECQCCNLDMDLSEDMMDCSEGNILRRTWTATDLCGNSSSYTQEITLIDNEAPTIERNSPNLGDIAWGSTMNFSCIEAYKFIFSFDEDDVIATDDCGDAELTFNAFLLNSGNCKADGFRELWQVEWTATDRCGNETQRGFSVRIIDNQPPEVLSFPESNCSSVPDPDDISFSDNCDNNVQYSYTIDTLGIEGCNSAINLRYSYTFEDDCGNTNTASRIYLVNDNTPPVLKFNRNYEDGDTVIFQCESFQNTDLENFVTSRDECGAEVKIELINHSPLPDPCNASVLSRFEWIATDNCSNSSSLELYIGIEDNNPPSIVGFSSNIEISCADEIPSMEDYNIRDCNGYSVTYSDVITEGKCENNKEIERSIVLRDDCGNSNTLTQNIRVIDDEGPVMVSDAVVCGNAGRPVFNDECGGGVQNARLMRSDTTETCPDYMKVVERWRVEDNCGNIANHRRVIIDDNIAPELEMEVQGFDINLGDTTFMTCDFPELDQNSFTAYDQCGQIPINFSQEIKDFNCSENDFFRTISYRVSAVDECGNRDDMNFVIAYIDNEAPILSDYPDDITTACADGSEQEIFAVDNCSGELKVDFTEESESDSVILQTWTASDDCGNSEFHERRITLIDELECNIQAPDSVFCWTTFTLDAEVTGGQAPFTYDWNIINGECEINESTDTESSVDIVILFGEVLVELTVTDDNGCQTRCTYSTECIKKGKSTPRTTDDLGKFTFFPNPTSEYLYLENVQTMNSVRIVSVDGKTMQIVNTNDSKGEILKIEVNDWENGMYYIITEENDKVQAYKFIKIN